MSLSVDQSCMTDSSSNTSNFLSEHSLFEVHLRSQAKSNQLHMTRSTRFAFFLLVLTIFPLTANAQNAAKTDSLKIQEKFNFTLTDVKGNDVKFSDFLGKGPLLVSFWALWCEPCKQEMKAFRGLVDKFKSQGVAMVAINTDQVRSLAKVRAYVTTQKIDFPILTDPDGSVGRDIFSLESLPYSLILMPDGTVYKRHMGYTAGDEQTTEKEITELVDQLSHKK
jgi:peroxiredoxin